MTDERADYLASGSEEKTPDRERLDVIRHVLGLEITWSEPPPEVTDRLLAAIGDGKTATPAIEPMRRRLWPWAAATAAAILLVVTLTGPFDSAGALLVAMEGTSAEPGASGQASIHESGSGWWIRLEVDGLPAAGEGTYYEAWMWSDEGDGISVGTFHLRAGDEPITLWSGVDPREYPSLWVTLEPEDGDSSASDQIVLKGRADEA